MPKLLGVRKYFSNLVSFGGIWPISCFHSWGRNFPQQIGAENSKTALISA